MQYNQELLDALADCIRHHQIIAQAHKMTQEIVGPMMLIKTFQQVWLCCNATFAASQVWRIRIVI